MMHFTDATGLLGNAVAIAALASRAPGISRLAPAARRGALAAVLVISLIPLGGLPLAGYLRGAVGDLSVTSLLLLGFYLARLLGAQPRASAQAASGRDALRLLVASAAVVFYPLALGWGSFDPYRLGYGSFGFLACLLALATWGALRASMVAAAIALAVLAWSAGWYESPNLWDYLMDPLVSAYCIAALVWRGVRRLSGRRRLQ